MHGHFFREILKDDKILADSIAMPKFILKEQMRRGGLDSADSEYGPMPGPCEKNTNLWSAHNQQDFFASSANTSFSRYSLSQAVN
jgi:hypothetical protein